MTGAHWDDVYATKGADELSWTQPEPRTSLRLLTSAVPPPASVIDVGAGSSTLVDALLAAGYADITALDVSAEALAASQQRLGPRANEVTWVVTDLLRWDPDRTYDAWHDRAVFHFLVDPEDRTRYVELATQAATPGGAIIIGTFAQDGPTQCSGLPIARYEPTELAALFGPAFVMEHSEREQHQTPWGNPQSFSWATLRREH